MFFPCLTGDLSVLVAHLDDLRKFCASAERDLIGFFLLLDDLSLLISYENLPIFSEIRATYAQSEGCFPCIPLELKA